MAHGQDGILAGQTAIVTGASSGIGEAIARRLAAAGAVVGVNHSSASSAKAASEIARAIEAAGGRAHCLEADVSQEAEVERMVEGFVAAERRLDILIANAGIQRDASFAEMSLAQWNEVLAVNLTGQFLCARAAIRQFRAQPRPKASRAIGKILCMSSVHEVIPWAGHVNYAASKGGVMLMMKSLAQEVAPERIRVNGIAPGAIKTRINQAAWETPEAEARLLELIPYGRVGEPDDVAEAALFLVSDAADYITGTTLFVDGGMTLYPGFADNG
jgi:glucose 1-dehydrogenase